MTPDVASNILRRMRTLLFSMGLATFAATATARIGETQAQIDARYGQPAKVDGNRRTYLTKGFQIEVEFLEGKSEMELFVKPGKHGSTEEISDNEITTLLRANGGEQRWVDATPEFTFTAKVWRTDTGTLNAGYLTSSHALMISSAKYQARSAEEKRAQESKQLSGF